MKNTKCTLIALLVFLMYCSTGWATNGLNSDVNYSIKIAVTINGNDNIIGKMEYSNNTLQMVTFNKMGDTIHSEPYLFEILEKVIIAKNVHRIKCRSVNGQYGSSMILGTIDFRDEVKPKVHLVNENGNTYLSNISEKGKKLRQKYLLHVWLGQ